MTGEIDAAEARRILDAWRQPVKWVTGVDPADPPPDFLGGPTVVVDDMKIDHTPALLAAQTHALLAVAAELAEANRIARERPATPDWITNYQPGREETL